MKIIEILIPTYCCPAREVDGHAHEALFATLGSVPWSPVKPSVLIAHAIKGKGVSFMMNRVAWHYRSPNDEQLGAALAELVDEE